MLPRLHRLRRSADIERLRQQGQTWRHPIAILLVCENDLNASRFAFMASRRVGGAVARNRSKRVLREAVRHMLSRIEPGWDCLFVARPSTPQTSFAEVENTVQQLLARAKLVVKDC
jgi:ribonuclease P protein component